MNQVPFSLGPGTETAWQICSQSLRNSTYRLAGQVVAEYDYQGKSISPRVGYRWYLNEEYSLSPDAAPVRFDHERFNYPLSIRGTMDKQILAPDIERSHRLAWIGIGIAILGALAGIAAILMQVFA